eukprot:3121366-Rhodomonas_salina.3
MVVSCLHNWQQASKNRRNCAVHVSDAATSDCIASLLPRLHKRPGSHVAWAPCSARAHAVPTGPYAHSVPDIA